MPQSPTAPATLAARGAEAVFTDTVSGNFDIQVLVPAGWQGQYGIFACNGTYAPGVQTNVQGVATRSAGAPPYPIFETTAGQTWIVRVLQPDPSGAGIKVHMKQ